VTIKPLRVVKEQGEISMVEVWEHRDGTPERLAGYYVYGGTGDSSVLHPSLAQAEAEFLRRIQGATRG